MDSIIQKTIYSEQGRKWFQLFVFMGAIFISLFVATQDLDTRLVYGILAMPGLIVGGLLLLRFPQLGFLLIVVISTVVKFDIPPIGLVATLILGLTALWIFDMVVRQKRIALVDSSTMAPLFAFTAVVILALIVGQLPWFSVSQVNLDTQIGGTAIFILSFAAFILVAHQVRDVRWLKWMVFLYLILAVPLLLIGLQVPGWWEMSQVVLNYSTVGGSLFWLWLSVLAFSQGLFNKQLPMKWRIALVILLLAYLYRAFVMNRAWTSGWAPVLVALFVTLWVARPKWAMPITMIGVAILILMFQPIYNGVMIGDNEYSTITRVAAWEIVLRIARVNPILGLGPGNYYNYTLLYPILGWYVRFNSHNNYVDILAQTGIAGMAVFFWFVFVTWKLGWRLRNQVPKDGFTQAFIYGALGGLAGGVVAAMFGDWVLPFVFNIGIYGMRASVYFWLFLGGLVAIDQMRRAGIPLD
ncbi:MAG: O-antigen ligase family protein [Anaerolineales bacterium]|nr:O-antigen ligase family protein [Anaerolineales bacterium]